VHRSRRLQLTPAPPRERRARDGASMRAADGLDTLLGEIRGCAACAMHLPSGTRPILQASTRSRLLIVGQAPSARVHRSGVPWDDASGQRLREWLAIDRTVFYDPAQVAIVPMGFCYPGRGRSGDLPPRPECAALWLDRLLAQLRQVELTLLVGHYAQRHFLGTANRPTLTQTVAAFADFTPQFMPLPHPSPRNNGWLKRHPWFDREVLPPLRERLQCLLPRATPCLDRTA
jgi:uracil-DNA glycosylase